MIERWHDRREIVLHREDVGHLPVVAFGHEVRAVRGGDQLGGDADAVAGASHASSTVLTPSDAAMARMSCSLSRKGERRGAGGHLQLRDVGQKIDDLLREPVAEVLLLLVAAQVGEGSTAIDLAGAAAAGA
jgi:hypothetical protein